METRKTADKVFRRIASSLQARKNCESAIQKMSDRTVADESQKKSIDNSAQWFDRHEDTIREVMKTSPSGSGIDSGTKFDFDNSTPEKLIFFADFHHMNEGGFYDGWTEHKVIVTPSLQSDFNIKITGRNRNQVKDYLYDVYDSWLRDTVEMEFDPAKDVFTGCTLSSYRIAREEYLRRTQSEKE